MFPVYNDRIQFPRNTYHPQLHYLGVKNMTALTMISGIGEVYAEKLVAAGIRSTEKLLQSGATRKGREELAEATEIAAGNILSWVNRADLLRVKGIGTQYSDLLEEAGVDTVPELAQRNADNLLAKMTEVAGEKNLVRKLPTATQVAVVGRPGQRAAQSGRVLDRYSPTGVSIRRCYLDDGTKGRKIDEGCTSRRLLSFILVGSKAEFRKPAKGRNVAIFTICFGHCHHHYRL